MKSRIHSRAAVLLGLFAAIGTILLLGANASPAHASNPQDAGYVAAIGNRSENQTDPWGFASYNCTSYAAYRVNKAGTSWHSDGRYDAYQWPDRAREKGISVDKTPRKGDVAVWGRASWNGYYGHVAYVESVNSDGSANVSEYNFTNPYGYDTRPHVRADEYIHFGDHSPFGNFETLKRAPGGARIGGWAIDPDTTGAIRVDTYGGTGNPGGGNPGKSLTANVSRPDVGKVYPKYGSNHGYDGLIGLPYGSHTVCSYAINVGPGSHNRIGCRSINISPDPFGNLDGVTPVNGGVQVSGWAIDPDTASPVRVDVYGGDGGAKPGVNPGQSFTANVSRPDVGRAYPDYGDLHGYSGFFALKSGQQTVCAYAINASGTSGANKKIGCKTVTVP